MTPEATKVAAGMRSTLASLHAMGRRADAAAGKIRDAAAEHTEVLEQGMPARRAAATGSADSLDAYQQSLIERERTHRVAGAPE